LVVDRFEDPDDYGSAKVACENAVLAAFGPGRSLIARAGLIAGPGDPTHRTDYWPWRFAHPAVDGRVLVPDAPDLPTSVIDVRDLAEWLVRCAEQGTVGIYNAMGPSIRFADHLMAAKAAVASEADPVVAPEQWLLDHQVAEWSGDRSLPLWLSDPAWYGMSARSNARAIRAGLTFRPLGDTLRDGFRWRESRPADSRADTAGLSDDDERQLLGELATR
jgi:hypothetical protein